MRSKARSHLTSLLPPVTAPGQALTISRIDWTLPFSAVDMRFGFQPTTASRSQALDTDIAEGHASWRHSPIATADPRHDCRRRRDQIHRSGLAGHRLQSRQQGQAGRQSHRPHPLHHGPGWLPHHQRPCRGRWTGPAVGDRSVWAQGDAAINSNAVQDFAYQALENLAFDQMSAPTSTPSPMAGCRSSFISRAKAIRPSPRPPKSPSPTSSTAPPCTSPSPCPAARPST